MAGNKRGPNAKLNKDQRRKGYHYMATPEDVALLGGSENLADEFSKIVKERASNMRKILAES